MLITIGAFDGFHRGHSRLFALCRENSGSDGWAVVTFNPHPAQFLGRIKTLFTSRERSIIGSLIGIPKMYVFTFDNDFMRMTPEKFWHLLKSNINVDGLVLGKDFRFGYNRDGDAKMLESLARSDGVKKIIIAGLFDKPKYSSSNARELIKNGMTEQVIDVLGYPFFMFSKVIRGNQRGRTMNFPTANIYIDSDRLIPAFGVYSCCAAVRGELFCGALSIGRNPTFHDVEGIRAEVNILDFDGDIYGDDIAVIFLRRLRGIKTFSGPEKLSEQIAKDIDACRAVYDEMMQRQEIREFSQHLREYTTAKRDDKDKCILIRTAT